MGKNISALFFYNFSSNVLYEELGLYCLFQDFKVSRFVSSILGMCDFHPIQGAIKSAEFGKCFFVYMEIFLLECRVYPCEYNKLK